MVDTENELQRFDFLTYLCNIIARVQTVGKYVVFAVWSSLFVGIVVCLGIYGWRAVIEFITSAADQARARSHIWDDLLFFSLLLFVGVCVFPGMSMLELTCGFVLGFKEAFLINFLGTASASLISFGIGRNFFKDSLNKYLISGDALRYSEAIERRNGLGLLILLRLMFLPFFVKNYVPAVIESTSWFHFVTAVVITSPAYSALFAFLGSEAKSIADLANGTHPEELTWLEVLPLVVSVLAGGVFTWMAYVEFQSLTRDTSEEPKDHEEGLKVPLVTTAHEAG